MDISKTAFLSLTLAVFLIGAGCMATAFTLVPDFMAKYGPIARILAFLIGTMLTTFATIRNLIDRSAKSNRDQSDETDA